MKGALPFSLVRRAGRVKREVHARRIANVHAPPGSQAEHELHWSSIFLSGFSQPPCPIACWLRLYPRTETPEKDSTARPRTGWPKKRAGSKRLVSSMFSICERVTASEGPEAIR